MNKGKTMKNAIAAMLAAAFASGSLFAEDHAVTFRRIDGTILERRMVPHGGTTSLPDAPEVPHFRFKEWDRAERLACVTNALDLWALYEDDGTKTWSPNSKIQSKSIAERDEQYTLEEYFKLYNNLEWTDEFSRGTDTPAKINMDNWKYDTDPRGMYSVMTSGGNQMETNGCLALTVRREEKYGFDIDTYSFRKHNFTSGGIRSDGKVEFKYGRCEVRAKLTREPGVAPAFWMIGGPSWPGDGEIDVFEQPSGGEWIASNMHVTSPSKEGSLVNTSTCAPPDGVHYGDGFHRFGVIINERELVFYVDNHIYKRIDAREERYEMIRRCYQRIILGVGIDDGWLVDGPGLAKTEDEVPAEFQSVDFLVDYCRIYTNTKEGNTVALELPPAEAKLSAPVKATVWYGEALEWGRPGFQVMNRCIGQLGWGDMYLDLFNRMTIEAFVEREKPDVIAFLTMPIQSPASNMTPCAAPGMVPISISAKANMKKEYYVNGEKKCHDSQQLYAGFMFDSDRFSTSESSVGEIKLSDDVNFTNCVAVCADLVENATGARVKVVGVNVTATNGYEDANGVVAKGFSTLFEKLNAMKDDNVILFFQGMNVHKYNYIRGRASKELDPKFEYLGSSKVEFLHQCAYVSESVSASSDYPEPLALTNPKGTKSGAYTNFSFCATAQFSEPATVAQPEPQTGFAHEVSVAFTGYAGGSTLADFPVLVRLSENVPGFSYADFQLENGGDLRFFDAAGNLLSHEIDTWNPNGVSTAWVKVPSLNASTAITACYGCANPPAVNPKDVWSNGYVGVWHLGESALPMKESSGESVDFNEAKGSNLGYAEAGVVGGSVDFNGLNGGTGGLRAPDSDALDGFAACTFEMWTWQKRHDAAKQRFLLAKRVSYNSDISYNIYDSFDKDSTTNKVACGIASDQCAGTSSDVWASLPASATPELGSWNMVAHVYDSAAGRVKAYLNGTGKTDAKFAKGVVRAGAGKLVLGNQALASDYAFPGKIDEVRISNVARSADWIKATHDTVMNPGFATYSTSAGKLAGYAAWMNVKELVGKPGATTAKGIPNVIRYAFDIDPAKGADEIGEPVLKVVHDSNGKPAVKLRNLAEGRGDVAVSVLASEDLSDWSKATVVPMEEFSEERLWTPASNRKSGGAPSQMFFRYKVDVK